MFVDNVKWIKSDLGKELKIYLVKCKAKDLSIEVETEVAICTKTKFISYMDFRTLKNNKTGEIVGGTCISNEIATRVIETIEKAEGQFV